MSKPTKQQVFIQEPSVNVGTRSQRKRERPTLWLDSWSHVGENSPPKTARFQINLIHKEGSCGVLRERHQQEPLISLMEEHIVRPDFKSRAGQVARSARQHGGGSQQPKKRGGPNCGAENKKLSEYGG